MDKNWTRRVAILSVVCISGCATRAELPDRATEFQLPPGAKVALAAGRFDPLLGLDAKIRGRGEGGATGALGGAAMCFRAGSGGDWVDVLLALACLPFGVTYGAVTGATGAAPEANVVRAEQEIASASKTLDLQGRLVGRVQRYATERGIGGLSQLADEGPQSMEDTPRYRVGPEYVIELAVTEVRATTPGSVALPYGFVVSARLRLVRVPDNVVVDTFTSRRGIDARTVDEWTADSGKLLAEQFGVALQQISEDVVDELFPLYRGEMAGAADTGARPTPAYVLRPVRPMEVTYRMMRSPAEGGFGPLLPEKVDSATPLLAWEKLPRTVPAELFTGASPRARNLVYDVWVFGAGGIRRYSDLKVPEIRIEEALAPCRYYRWTVRARFELEGTQRATEWSGAYFVAHLHGDTVIDPGWARRSQWPSSIWIPGWPNFAYYFSFLTPSADGKPCTKPR